MNPSLFTWADVANLTDPDTYVPSNPYWPWPEWWQFADFRNELAIGSGLAAYFTYPRAT